MEEGKANNDDNIEHEETVTVAETAHLASPNSEKRMTLLEHIKQIIEFSKEEGLTEGFYEKAKKSIRYLCRKAGISQIEAVFFSHFLYNADRHTSIYDIGKDIKLDNLETMKYLSVLESLEKKNYIQERSRFNSEQKHYSVPTNIQKMVGSGKFLNQKKTGLTIEDVFNQVEVIFNKIDDREIDYESYEGEIINILENNKTLPFINMLDLYGLSYSDKTIFMSLCNVYLESEINLFSIKSIDCIYRYSYSSNLRKLRNAFSEMKHKLFTVKILEPANNLGFGDKNCFCFTQEVVDTINKELGIKFDSFKSRKGLMLYEDIQEKIMFYNEDEKIKIDDLSSLLDEENFKNIKDRLSKSSMRTGFACLFSGEPGTGKTETVYQLAKKTGRDIMMVDVSETKSKWFSESEKLTKEIFTRYRRYVNESDNAQCAAPILFFNEADAIFSKRRTLNESRSGPDQTENALQNIILQEMETLDGILICTTNLTKNFDKAFERRFLYKIEFRKPSLEVRKQIWHSMIPDLSCDIIDELAKEFDFSGGQIENIARKRSVEIVLRGAEPSLEKLMDYCRDELMEKDSAKVIGFYS